MKHLLSVTGIQLEIEAECLFPSNKKLNPIVMRFLTGDHNFHLSWEG